MVLVLFDHRFRPGGKQFLRKPNTEFYSYLMAQCLKDIFHLNVNYGNHMPLVQTCLLLQNTHNCYV